MKPNGTLLFTLLFCLAASATLNAEGPDRETRALIEKLRLEESNEPIRNSPLWEKPDKVYVALPPVSPEQREQYLASAREVAGDVELAPFTLRFGQPVDKKILDNAEVLLGFCTPQIIRQAEQLRWLQHYGSGVNHCMIPEIKKRDLIMTNNQHTAAPPISEHVIAMMMMLTRGLQHFHSDMAGGKWQGRAGVDFPMIEVGGKTMLVAGLGGIGTEVAKRANALGMRVLATRNTSREGPGFVEYVGLSHELLELAKQADVVVNALPLTDETTDLFDREFFNAVKPGAYFISIGRGGSTVTEYLLAALRDGRLNGAGLDVTDPEPLPPDHPLWDQPNVIITPHVAGMTDRGFERGWLVIRENLRRYINGEKLLNVVDIERGY